MSKGIKIGSSSECINVYRLFNQVGQLREIMDLNFELMILFSDLQKVNMNLKMITFFVKSSMKYYH
jgi:hypothetical protein